jgi:hypothetical protein
MNRSFERSHARPDPATGAPPRRFVNLGVLAHVDAGKTSLTETLLLHGGAILVVSAVEGVQAQTIVLFRALRRLGIPTVFFVNKIDRAGADPERVIYAIAQRLTPALVPLTTVLGPGTAGAEAVPRAWDEEVTAHLAEHDERRSRPGSTRRRISTRCGCVPRSRDRRGPGPSIRCCSARPERDRAPLRPSGRLSNCSTASTPTAPVLRWDRSSRLNGPTMGGGLHSAGPVRRAPGEGPRGPRRRSGGNRDRS